MGKNILVIEDNDHIRENIAEILEIAGYDTQTAENGKVGVELAQQQVPDLVLCDIMMPVLDGFGVLHIFQRNPRLAGVPFIFLTAKTERGDFRRGMEMGADDYITKPFTELELLNAIESRIRKHSYQEQRHSSLEQFLTNVKTHQELQDLAADRKVHYFKKKQIIYCEGGEANKLYFLKTGRIKTYYPHPDGKELITDIYQGGDFFGYTALIENKPYPETAEALEDCYIISIPRQEFLALLFRNQQVAYQFIKLLANNAVERERLLLNMAYNSLRKRIAEVLCTIAPKFGKESGEITLAITREDLAAAVGTATESLIRTLSDFKDEGLLEIVKGKIVLKDLQRLKRLKF